MQLGLGLELGTGNGYFIAFLFLVLESDKHLCLALALRVRVIKLRAVLQLNVERSWPGFENEGREIDGRETRRERVRMHQQTSRACETSQRRSVNYDNRYLA